MSYLLLYVDPSSSTAGNIPYLTPHLAYPHIQPHPSEVLIDPEIGGVVKDHTYHAHSGPGGPAPDRPTHEPKGPRSTTPNTGNRSRDDLKS